MNRPQASGVPASLPERPVRVPTVAIVAPAPLGTARRES
jgi:hypothetical protein